MPGRGAELTRTAQQPTQNSVDEAFVTIAVAATATAGAASATQLTTVVKPCGCGHSKEAHQHYRAGTDCSGCDCVKYRRQPLTRRGLLAPFRRQAG